MRKFIRNIFVLFIISLILLSNVYSLYAEDDAQVYASETLAVSLVIDTSGSMSDTDADNLRRAAADLFVDLLSEDDYLGVLTFNSDVTEVLSMQQVGDTSNRTNIKNSFDSLTVASGDTDYVVALNAASNQLAQVTDDNVKKVIIFITDGAPDPDSSKSDDQDYMNSYLETLWNAVDTLAQNGYAVYSIGFSDGIRTDILSQISDETGGSFKILSSSSALASSLFQVLDELKNRIEFMDETADISQGYSFDVELNENTTQSTIVIVNQDNSSYDIEIRDSSGNLVNSQATISTESGYTLIRINNDGEVSEDTWTVTLTGSGTVQVLGDRDLTLKLWLLSPESSTAYGYGDSIDVEAKVTGEVDNAVAVSAVITDPNGESQTVSLTENDEGIYQGEYDNTTTYGDYTITTNLLLDGEVVSTKTETFTVGIMPDLKASFYINSEGYRVGESILASAWLSYEGSRLINGSSVEVNSFILRITDEDGNITDINLLDNGNESNNDSVSNDGIWSGIIELTKATVSEATLVVSGTFQNVSFNIEEDLGSYVVYDPGIVHVSSSEEIVISKSGGKAIIPLTFYNESEFEEIVQVSIESELGETITSEITLEPGETKEVDFEIAVNKGIDTGVYGLNYTFTADNAETTVDQSDLNVSVDIVSGSTYLLYQMNIFINLLIEVLGKAVTLIVLGIIILILLVILIVRSILRKIRRSMEKVRGKLEYWKNETGPENSQILLFDEKKKDSIIVSFSGKNEKADYHIKGTRFNHDLVFSIFSEKISMTVKDIRRFIFKKYQFKIMVTVTPPGIIEKDGEIYSSLIVNGEEFISGGYTFRLYPSKEKTKTRRKGKNLLEKKNEKGKSV